MSNDELQFAADVERLFAQFPSFLKAAELLKQLGSAKQAASDTQNAATEAAAKIKAAADAYAAAKRAEADDLLSSAQTAATKAVAQAGEQAKQIVIEAQDRAQAATDEADQKVKAAISEADVHSRRSDAAKADLATTAKITAEHKILLADLAKQIQVKKEELSGLSTQHHEFLARIGAR